MINLLTLVLLNSPMQRDPNCMTKHGVTHCWERLGEWDPRYALWEWDTYGRLTDPPRYGYYPLEKHE